MRAPSLPKVQPWYGQVKERALPVPGVSGGGQLLGGEDPAVPHDVAVLGRDAGELAARGEGHGDALGEDRRVALPVEVRAAVVGIGGEGPWAVEVEPAGTAELGSGVARVGPAPEGIVIDAHGQEIVRDDTELQRSKP